MQTNRHNYHPQAYEIVKKAMDETQTKKIWPIVLNIDYFAKSKRSSCGAFLENHGIYTTGDLQDVIDEIASWEAI